MDGNEKSTSKTDKYFFFVYFDEIALMCDRAHIRRVHKRSSPNAQCTKKKKQKKNHEAKENVKLKETKKCERNIGRGVIRFVVVVVVVDVDVCAYIFFIRTKKTKEKKVIHLHFVYLSHSLERIQFCPHRRCMGPRACDYCHRHCVCVLCTTECYSYFIYSHFSVVFHCQYVYIYMLFSVPLFHCFTASSLHCSHIPYSYIYTQIYIPTFRIR